MRKIKNTDFSNTINGIKLYYEDLENILEDFKENYNIEFKDEDYIYDSIEDIIHEKGNNPRIIFINIQPKEQPSLKYLNMRFKGTRFTIFSSSFYEEAKSIFEFIEKKRTFLFFLLRPFYSSMVLILTGILYLQNIVFIPFYAVLIALFWTLLSFYYQEFDLGLHLIRRHESSFIQKYKDKILLTVIGGVLGLCLKIIYDYITKN